VGSIPIARSTLEASPKSLAIAESVVLAARRQAGFYALPKILFVSIAFCQVLRCEICSVLIDIPTVSLTELKRNPAGFDAIKLVH
jgi:hypothetical protein